MDLDTARPLRVVVFFSGGASGFRYLREHDPGYGDAYEVVGAFTDDPGCSGIDAFRDEGVPVASRDIRAFYEERGADRGDLDVREAFDARTAEAIGEFDPDVVVLSGYMWILTDPVLERYPVVNVHPADLTITEDGERTYVGSDPVYDAVTDGRTATRSSVHLVTPTVDAGPLLVMSEPVPVHRELVEGLRQFGSTDALRNYVDAHQEWMKWAADGPALATALGLLAEGRVEWDPSSDSRVRIDGAPGPYELGDDEP